MGKCPYLVEMFRCRRLKENIFYIDMELCRLNLEKYIAREIYALRSDLQSEVARQSMATRILWQIASGVEFIHSCNVVHSDLTSRNGTSSPT